MIYFVQSQAIQSPLPVRFPESNFGKRDTGINIERFSNTMALIPSEIDHIVPSTREGVSKITILTPN